MPANKPKRPTLKTISELSGFAVPTVSRALHDAPDIGKTTKDTVRRIAREIGYVPNRAGVRLKTGRTNVISLVLSTEYDMMNHTARLISAVAGKLRDTNYHAIVTPYFADEDPMKPVQYIFETGSADAVILNRTLPDDPRVAYLLERKFPFATHGQTNQSQLHPYFDFDNHRYGQYCVEALVARGRKHILMVAPPPNQNYARMMLEGAKNAAMHNRVTATRLTTATGDDASIAIRRAVSDYLAQTPALDGIICASTPAAMAAVAAIEESGGKVGEDVDVCAKEAVEFLNVFRPDIISVKEDVTRAGEFLAAAAIQAIRAPELPPMQKLDFPEQIARSH